MNCSRPQQTVPRLGLKIGTPWSVVRDANLCASPLHIQQDVPSETEIISANILKKILFCPRSATIFAFCIPDKEILGFALRQNFASDTGYQSKCLFSSIINNLKTGKTPFSFELYGPWAVNNIGCIGPPMTLC